MIFYQSFLRWFVVFFILAFSASAFADLQIRMGETGVASLKWNEVRDITPVIWSQNDYFLRSIGVAACPLDLHAHSEGRMNGLKLHSYPFHALLAKQGIKMEMD